MPSCILCSHQTTTTGMNFHLFSKTHLPFWKERIRSCRSGFSLWIAEYEAGKKTLLSPLPSFSGGKDSSIRYRICFGCKKVATDKKTHECDSIEKQKKTVEMYKKILKEEEDVVVKEDEVAPSSDEVKKLQEKVAKLEKELKTVKVTLEAYQNKEDDEEESELQKKADKSDAYKSALGDVFRDLERHEEIYKDIRGLFEEYYPSLIEDV